MDEELELQKLRQFLNTPKAPEDLATKLKANLDLQIQEPEPQLSRSWLSLKRWYGLVAGVTLALAVAWHFKSGPDLVIQAHAHAIEEAHLVGALDGGYWSWFEAAGLSIPVEADRIVLSKNCVVDRMQAKHLRFEFPGNTAVNLFLYREAGGLPADTVTEGAIDGQAWLAFSPRGNVHLLAVYDPRVDRSHVERIIQSMFKEQNPNEEQA
jgi:hypothetical protein